jgi:OHCU decarboxylase
VASGRPYRDVDALLDGAEAAWAQLKPGDWLRVFGAHPRIGESGGHAPATSASEQSSVWQASAGTLAALTAENRRYEARFGHIFLIAARGRTADEILHALRQRMNNDPYTELEVAAAEQRKITRLRLLALVDR